MELCQFFGFLGLEAKHPTASFGTVLQQEEPEMRAQVAVKKSQDFEVAEPPLGLVTSVTSSALEPSTPWPRVSQGFNQRSRTTALTCRFLVRLDARVC